MDERKAKAKLVRFAELHPTSLEQKAKLIVEDFRDNIAGRLGGRAKAMVVTTGRQHALDLYQAIRKFDVELPGCGFGVLVAFSGTLKDEHTELGVHRGAAQRLLRGAAAGQVRVREGRRPGRRPRGTRTSTGSWSSRTSTRPGSTSRCCAPCTWTSR